MTKFYKAELIPNIEKFAHCSSIVELPNGDLMVSSYAGSGEKNKDTKIYTVLYDKGSESWQKPQIRINTPNKSDGNAVLFLDKNNGLWLFNNTIHKERKNNPNLWAWALTDNKYIYSEDFGKTWLAPVEMFPDYTGLNFKNKAIYLKDGTILLPVYNEPLWQSHIAISNDEGKSWILSEPILTIDPNSGENGEISRRGVLGNLQPTLIEKENGDILALLRPRGLKRILFSLSIDKGKTWSPAKETRLKNPGSGIDMIKTVTGNILLVYNDLSLLRYRLSIILSDDEGKTWKNKKRLEYNPPGGFSYPAIIQDREGLIHITYTYKRKCIKHIIINEEWMIG